MIQTDKCFINQIHELKIIWLMLYNNVCITYLLKGNNPLKVTCQWLHVVFYNTKAIKVSYSPSIEAINKQPITHTERRVRVCIVRIKHNLDYEVLMYKLDLIHRLMLRNRRFGQSQRMKCSPMYVNCYTNIQYNQYHYT